MTELWIDFETCSTLNVREVGAYRLLTDDPDLQVTLATYAIGAAPVQAVRNPLFEADVWTVRMAMPAELVEALEDPDVLIYAHNATFERLVLRRLGYDIAPERFRDTATIARWYNLPAGLKGFAEYAADDVEKLDASSFKLLWRHQRENEDDEWQFWPDSWADMYEEMVEYGIRDVEAMRAATIELPPLPDEVWEEYAVSERINDRGIAVDIDLIEAVRPLRAAVEHDASAELAKLTQGAVTSSRGPAARKFVEQEIAVLEREGLLTVPLLKEGELRRGFKKRRSDSVGFYTDMRATFDKSMRAAVRLALAEVGSEADNIREVLDAVDEGNVAALTKFEALDARSNDDCALRGGYIFAGATQTHRFSDTGVQRQNLLRATHGLDRDWHLRRAIVDAKGSPDVVRAALVRLYPDPKERPGLPKALGMLLRPTFTARKGKVLVWRDWSSIEARALPWLADDEEADELLGVFRRGEDIYVREAQGIFGPYDPETDPDAKEKRQIGKVGVLSLGFGGSVGAYAAMGRNYGISLPTERVKGIVAAWRANNTWASRFWHKLLRAATAAMQEHNWCEWQPAGRVQFIFAPNILNGALMMALPDGSILTYPRARVEMVERFEGQPKEPTICFDHPVYGRSAIWYGLLAENATQAICASLLRDALRLATYYASLDVVMHTHDEIVVECADDDTEIEAVDAALKRCMETLQPEWADGLPVASEGGVGFRYKLEESVE